MSPELSKPAIHYRKTVPSMSALAAALAIYDTALAALAILVSTEALNRFGIGSAVWLLVYAMALGRIALSQQTWIQVFSRNLWQFAYPFVALLSVVWSIMPSVSLVAVMQTTMSLVVATVIGARFRLRSLIILTFVVIAATAFLSLVNWLTGIFGTVYAGSGGLLGIYSQKNALGQRVLVAILCGAVLLVLAGYRNALFTLGLLGALAMMALALHLSQSVTSIILSLPFAGLLFLLCAHRLDRRMVFLVIAAVYLSVALLPVTFAVLNVDPVSVLLGSFNKSSTLTGRTELWAIANEVIAKQPILGVGYMAFWESPRYAYFVYLAQNIGGEAVKGFHNFILEIWSSLGIFGLFAMAIFLWVAISRTVHLYWLVRSPEAAFGIVAIGVSITLALFGTSLYRQHEYSIILVMMIGVSAGEELWKLRWARRKAGRLGTTGAGSVVQAS